MLQATVMTIYMVIGVKCYMRVQATFTKTKFLLILMSFVIIFLVLYQLFFRKVYTLFLLMVLVNQCSYTTF
jgi:hypothetical protein